MVDLHLHSRYSDGDWPVQKIVTEAARRGLAGISLTDHNGVWGTGEAAAAAVAAGVVYVQGIEVTARFQGIDVHILGYARSFDEEVLEEGLTHTRAGYEARVREMVALCQQQGYPKVSFAAIQAQRALQKNPSYISYDVAQQLMNVYQLSWDEARKLTTRGGACHVPYGDWALTPSAATELLRHAGGKAFLAHPGIIIHEAGREAFDQLMTQLLPAVLDGIEVYHPFHDEALMNELTQLCEARSLLISGGSDWHGPNRYHHAAFGNYGLEDVAFAQFLDSLD